VENKLAIDGVVVVIEGENTKIILNN